MVVVAKDEVDENLCGASCCDWVWPDGTTMEPRYNSFGTGTDDFRPRDGLGCNPRLVQPLAFLALLAFPPQVPFRHTSPTADATRIAHPHRLELSRQVYAMPNQSPHIVRHVVSYHTLSLFRTFKSNV